MASRNPKHDKFPDFGMLGPGDPKVEPELETAGIPNAMIPQPVGYRVIIKPKPAAAQIGSIALASRTKNTDLATRTIGQLVAIGDLAWQATLDGLDYKKDAVARGFKVGDWVIFRQHGAQKVKIGTVPGAYAGDEDEEQYLLLMSDTDVLAKLTPEQADKIYDWVS